MNGQIIDRQVLAERLLVTRRREHLSQSEVATCLKDVGVTSAFLSNLENQRVAFREDHHHTWLRAIADHLQIEIPYVQKRTLGNGVEIRKLAPAPAEQEKPSVDIELIVINACGKQLLRLTDCAARERVLDYLKHRYASNIADRD